jgi:hypothetical protein
MNYETETHYDQQLNFIYEGFEYVWQGDYTVNYSAEDESEYAPGYGETEIVIDHTSSLFYFNPSTDEVIEAIPTPSILLELEIEIERNL